MVLFFSNVMFLKIITRDKWKIEKKMPYIGPIISFAIRIPVSKD